MNTFCNYCHKPASSHCSRCKIDVYCSEECQKSDFPTHRYVCFPIPPLVTSLKADRSDPVVNGVEEKLGNLKIVSANRTEPPVKLKKLEASVVTREIPKPIQEVPPKPKEVPKPVQQVPEEKKEVVKEIPKKLAEAVNREPQKADKQLKLPEIKQPPVPVKEDVKPVAVVQEMPPKQKEVPKPIEQVPPKQKEVPKPIEKVSEPQTAAPTPMPKPRLPPRLPKQQTQKTDRILYSAMKLRPLEKGKRKVIIMNGNPEGKIFFVNEMIDGVNDYITWIEDSVNQAVSTDDTTSYVPVESEMVLAKFEGVYYRGMCAEVNKDTFKILFVDYGNVEDCKATDIKPFNESLKMQITLVEIFVRNLPNPLNKKALDLLGNDNGIEIDVKGKREDGTYVCDMIGLD